VLLVDRPGLKQATVALGEPGVGLKDPDSPALDVLTSVLNNFGGRLFNQIRSREVRFVCDFDSKIHESQISVLKTAAFTLSMTPVPW
jgi:predicted Zn-dependent peptidase